MYAEFYALHDRENREQELSERMAGRRRQTLASRRTSLRAGIARRLFALAGLPTRLGEPGDEVEAHRPRLPSREMMMPR